jgi:hypothetical protein
MRGLNFLKIVIVANLIVSAAFSLIGVLKPISIVPSNAQINPGTTVFALYGAARAIPLAVIGLFAVFSNTDKRAILLFGVLAAVIQVTDGFIGIYMGDTTKAIGPFLLALLTFIGLYMNRSH